MSEKRYGIWGENTKDFLTYLGRILYHTDEAEMEFLFPNNSFKQIPGDIPDEQMMSVKDHPSMHTVLWPLDRNKWRK